MPDIIKIKKNVNLLGENSPNIVVMIINMITMIKLIFSPSNQPFFVAFLPINNPLNPNDNIGIIIFPIDKS